MHIKDCSKKDLYNRIKTIIFKLAESGDKFSNKFSDIYEEKIDEILVYYSSEDSIIYVPKGARNEFNWLVDNREDILASIPEYLSNSKLRPIKIEWLKRHHTEMKKVIKALEKIMDCLFEELINDY
ncbi:MAG: hypothetical protein IJ681_03880 [Bacteroidales bacterium]|nr:hypothetical protein [Bacteroidales bacterium]